MKNLKLNDKVTVFDQSGVITDVVDETREPYLYGVTFDATQKTYVIEEAHIKLAEDNRPITERIKTFEDAVAALGEAHPLVQHYKQYEQQMNGNFVDMTDITAYLKMRIIVAALNEGWEPKFEKGEWRYAPWFSLVTEEGFNEMDDEEKATVCRVVGRSSDFADAYGGIACAVANVASSSAYSGDAARLAFKTRELAEYAGKQFIEIWRDFIFA